MKERTDKLDYRSHLIDLILNSLSQCQVSGVHRLQSKGPTSAMNVSYTCSEAEALVRAFHVVEGPEDSCCWYFLVGSELRSTWSVLGSLQARHFQNHECYSNGVSSLAVVPEPHRWRSKRSVAQYLLAEHVQWRRGLDESLFEDFQNGGAALQSPSMERSCTDGIGDALCADGEGCRVRYMLQGCKSPSYLYSKSTGVPAVKRLKAD